MKRMRETQSDTSKLVERQMRNWELMRSQRRETKRPVRARVADFVCISRDVGAGGTKLGFDLGERLGWPVFDKDLMHAMAGDNDIRERIYASMDERDLGWLEEVIRSFVEPGFIKNDYMRRLGETVLSLARQGSAVFIGRGVDLILPREVGLRVRIVAPRERRIENLARQRGVSAVAARSLLAELEKERAQYVERSFGVTERDPDRYDLMINLERITAGQALDLIDSTHKALAGV